MNEHKHDGQLQTLSSLHKILGVIILFLTAIIGCFVGADIIADGGRIINGATIFLICGFLLSIIYSTCLLKAASFLKRRKNYWFSIFVAVLNCFNTPFGTALGIYTIVVLSKKSVRKAYRSP